jgi:hypothetical protein
MNSKLSLDSLLILRACLHAQQVTVGDPGFTETMPKVLKAHAELEAAIAEASIPAEDAS